MSHKKPNMPPLGCGRGPERGVCDDPDCKPCDKECEDVERALESKPYITGGAASIGARFNGHMPEAPRHAPAVEPNIAWTCPKCKRRCEFVRCTGWPDHPHVETLACENEDPVEPDPALESEVYPVAGFDVENDAPAVEPEQPTPECHRGACMAGPDCCRLQDKTTTIPTCRNLAHFNGVCQECVANERARIERIIETRAAIQPGVYYNTPSNVLADLLAAIRGGDDAPA